MNPNDLIKLLKEVENLRYILDTVTVQDLINMSGASQEECQQLYNFLHENDQ